MTGHRGNSIEEQLRAAGLPPLARLAWLEIDVEALAANLRAVRALVGASTRLGAVVKADGYGHGIEVAARTFVAAGADLVCVATLDEALLLRRSGFTAPILLLFAVPADVVPLAVEAAVELVLADEATSSALIDTVAVEVRRRGSASVRFHLEVETGLARAGIRPERTAAVAARVASTRGVELAGMWSHLASADDASISAAQRQRLDVAVAGLKEAGVPFPPRHLSATGGLIGGSGDVLEMVRPGLVLYGEAAEPLPVDASAVALASSLRPAMTLKARPLRVEPLETGETVGYGGTWRAARPSVVATLPVGYGDGWSRGSAPGSFALVRGRRVPLVGTVAMDAVIADVTDVPMVTPSEEFVLLGRQDGATITATELARLRNTISWEVLAGMAQRIARVYHAPAGPMGMRTLAGETLAGPRADPPP